jgi:hypothetical protein
MIDFITEAENKPADKFDDYFENVIEPLIEEENRKKTKYHTSFWVRFWSAVFLVCFNVLITLFRSVMFKHSFSYTQMLLVIAVALLIVVWPIVRFNHSKKHNIFSEFLKFFGSWKHIENNQVMDVNKTRAAKDEVLDNVVKIADGHLPIVPKHSSLNISHNAVGEYNGIKIQVRDAVYGNSFIKKNLTFNRNVAHGVRINFKLPFKVQGVTLLFDKSGFYRKNKYERLEKISTDIPAAGYFNIFSDNKFFTDNLLRPDFYETLLDLKDMYQARRIYVEIKNDTIKVFLENSVLYFDYIAFWSRKIDKQKFQNLYKCFEATFVFADTARMLAEQALNV